MNFVPVVSGFTQERDDKHGNGSVRLFREMSGYMSPETFVTLLEWHQDPEGYARMAARHLGPGQKVAAAAYSYGAGWWLRIFAETLLEAKPEAEIHAIVSDPVYRRSFPWILFQFRALFHQTLILKGNFRSVVWLYQKNNFPGGDSLAVVTPRPDDENVVRGPIKIDLTHQEMDNSEVYHREAIRMVESALSV